MPTFLGGGAGLTRGGAGLTRGGAGLILGGGTRAGRHPRISYRAQSR